VNQEDVERQEPEIPRDVHRALVRHGKALDGKVHARREVAKGPDPVMRKVARRGAREVDRRARARPAGGGDRGADDVGCAVYTVWARSVAPARRSIRRQNDSRSSAIDASLASARSRSKPKISWNKVPSMSVARKRAHRGKRVRHVADGDRAERRISPAARSMAGPSSSGRSAARIPIMRSTPGTNPCPPRLCTRSAESSM